MREAGAEVELFYTKKLDIKPCQGEFNCWLKTPGKCFQDDDMDMIHEKVRSASCIVMATPLYTWGMAGPLKNLLDRMIPLIEPFFDVSTGHCRHPWRQGTQTPKIVLVSNCGFWEMDNFAPLLKQLEGMFDDRFAGALLRPHGPLFAVMLQMGAPVHDVVEAAKEAGCELVRDGRMSPDTLNRVSRELMPLEEYVKRVNKNFEAKLQPLKAKAAPIQNL
jgi:multimeric flavodoxin WrbA